ncbi:MAG: HD domain-containing protein [Cyanobacteria bacterium]|nr:HD domain-containing protein [Cyanobacteriota bacterium]
MIRRFLRSPVDVYVGATTAVGAAVVGWSVFALWSTPHAREWFALAVLAMVTGRFPLRIPGTNAWFSISDTFFITSALMFGPAPATVTMAVDSLVISYVANVKTQRDLRLRRLFFNGSAPALAFFCGAAVFFRLSGLGPVFGDHINVDVLLLPLACFAGVYFILNSGLISMAVALQKQLSAVEVWRSHFMTLSLNYFASASAAFLLIVLTQYLSVIALVAVIPLLAVINLAMRSWTGRLEDAEQHVATVDRLYLSTIGALSTAIEAKDGVTSSHIHRVQHYAMGLARALGGLDEPTMKAIQAAALLHDTGKLAVPERILNKPGKLTPTEFETMKLHVDVGADILSSIDFPYPVVPIVRAHHENWDGTGYPNRLKGVEIPIGARILSVVDCYDALTSDRPYRAAMTDDDALGIIRARRGTMYDPIVVDMFERVCRDIAPMQVKPQLQKAIQQITKAVAPVQEQPIAPVAAPAAAVVNDGPESLRALANLARVVSGRPSMADLSSLIWSHVHHVVPNASCAFFVNDHATDAVKVAFVAGDAASLLQGLEMKLGERLTGWVAEHQQPMVNSDAKLDLGAEASLYKLNYCLALPLVADGQVAGVLSLYSAESFKEEQTQTLQFVMPHLGQMFVSLSRRSSDSPPAAAAKPSLRVVASR